MVVGNRAVVDPANHSGGYDTGAGIFADNGGLVTNSTFAANVTDGTGGGIAVHGDISVTNSTISGNSGSKAGGGIFARMPQGGSVSSSTLAGNSSARGAGIYLASKQSLHLESTIVADSAGGGADVGARYATTIAGANNLIVSSDAKVALPADTLQVDPLLAPLADNGGPTQTHALAPTSPAIDRGNNVAGLDTDQRGAGFRRSLGSAPDIGAFESVPANASSATQAAPIAEPWFLAMLAAAVGGVGAHRRWRRP